jgi:hypothetical protein
MGKDKDLGAPPQSPARGLSPLDPVHFFIFSLREKINILKGVQGNWFPCRVWAEPKVFTITQKS